jgi:hypothetical protein
MPVNRKSLLSLLLKLAIFSVVLTIGLLLYTVAFSNYEVSSFATTGIIYGSYANPVYGMNVNSFEMDINTQEQTIVLSIDFAYDTVGNYTLLMTLPFRIDSFHNLKSGNLYLKSTSSGSIAMFIYNINETSNIGYTFETASASFHINGSILDKVFEICTLNLPFGGSVTTEVSQELDSFRTISPFTIFGSGINGTVGITVPYSAIVTNPQQYFREPMNGFQWLDFSINEFKPFQFQYVDSAQRMNFERNLLISGVILGIAGSGFAEIVVELIPTKYRPGSVQENNSENRGSKMSEKRKENEKENILETIRWIDKQKCRLFKPLDILNGWAGFTIIMLGIMYVFLFYFNLTGNASFSDKIIIFLAFGSLAIPVIAFIAQFGRERLVEVNYRKALGLKKDFTANQKILLKALIKIKAENPEFELEELYNIDSTMFTEKKLLQRMISD